MNKFWLVFSVFMVLLCTGLALAAGLDGKWFGMVTCAIAAAIWHYNMIQIITIRRKENA